MEKKIRKVAIVGAGLWGEAHASIYNEHPYATPVAICDLNTERAKEFAAKFGIKEVYSDYNEMFAKCDCDTVAIVTPDFAHADIAVAAAEAGKDMIIEKPLATTYDDIVRMCKAFKKNNVRAMVDMHNRWNPPFNATKALVDSGKYGKPTNAHFRLTDNLWVATDMLKWCAKSSILWFLGSHSLDAANWIFNSFPTKVYSVKSVGRLKKAGVDTVDTYMSTYTYESGAVLQMENSWATPNGNTNVNDFKYYLLCEDGAFNINGSSHDLLQVTDQDRMITQDILVKNFVFDKCRGFAYESIRSFIDKLVSGEPFHVSIEECAKVCYALLKTMESADTGKVVDIDYSFLDEI